MVYTEDFYNDPCRKLDSWCVDAFFDLKLTPSDGTELTLDNSWNSTSVDLTPAVKAAETITHLLLTTSALQFNREDYGRDGAENNGVDCINGDDLSRIISMKYLKDVDQTKALGNGDVYMYNGNLFQPFNLQNFVNSTNALLSQHTQQIDALNTGLANLTQVVQQNYTTLNNKITALQTQVNNLQADYNAYKIATNNRLAAIEAVIAKPSWAPTSSRLVWGTINDLYQADPNNKGLYSHDPANNVVGDQRFQ